MVVMDEVSTVGRAVSGTWVPPMFLDGLSGIGDHDLVASGPDDAFLAQLTQDPDHDLPSRPDGVRQLSLADPDNQLGPRPLLRRRFGQSLGCQIEQMPSHALADVANALPEISETKLSTRSLTSLSRAVATRRSRSAARRATVGDILSSSASTSAWVGAGIAYGDANSDGAPMRAPGRQ
jgi:hypothetical protein